MRLPRRLSCWVTLWVAAVALLAAPRVSAQKDYLTQLEADKIRDAEEPRERIRLFVLFAEDRLKKFQYELAKGTNDRRRGERMNMLLEAFSGCMDDASGLMELGRMKQQDILKGVKFLQAKGKEFLAELEKQSAATPADASYKESLELAQLSVKEALEEAEKAAKEIAPGPVRRKQ